MDTTNPPATFFSPESLSRASKDYLLIAVFLKSRSDAFKWAIEIAHEAAYFAERDLGALKMHAAAFSKDRVGADRARQLIHYIRSWQGTQYYVNGRMIIGGMEQSYHVLSVLDCYAESCEARDFRAHCYRLIDSPYRPTAPRRLLEHIHPMFRHVPPIADQGNYTFPCKYMLEWFEAQHNHPASVQDQIQAEGIAKSCDVCPRFKPEDFGATSTIKKNG
jgi:hypothetical protein